MFYLILLCIDSRAARVLLSNQSVHISILYRFLNSAFLTGIPIRTDCLLIGHYPIIAGISLKARDLGPLRRHSVFNNLALSQLLCMLESPHIYFLLTVEVVVGIFILLICSSGQPSTSVSNFKRFNFFTNFAF